MLQGHLENIHADGLITGWCWDPEQPASRSRLTVLVDNAPIGDLVADQFRPDLEVAGVGDGAHAFSYLLPWTAIAGKSITSVHIADPKNNCPIGGALTFRRTAVLPVEQRLAELEHSARLLQARLDESNRHTQRMIAVVQSTLATIGSFFTQLADMPIESLSRTGQVDVGSASIGGLLTQARATYEPFTFTIPKTPLMTVCISGTGGLKEFYSCLRALKACGLDEEAEIVVIDSSLGEEIGLIPLIVQNIRYWRIGADQSLLTTRNRLSHLGDRELLLFLSPSVLMRAGWIEAVRDLLAAQPLCAVIGSNVLRMDGTIESSSLTLDISGRLTDVGCAETPKAPWLNRLQPVAAVPDHALLIRQSVFTEVEGFDPAYVDLAAATTDLCLRCWDFGYSVLHQPRGNLHWQDQGLITTHAASGDLGLDTLLAERWRKTERTAWPAPIGRALIIDTSVSIEDDTLARNVKALQELGYDLAFGNAATLGADGAAYDALRALGVEVLKAPYNPSILAAIEHESPSFDLIQLSASAASQVNPEILRTLAPATSIVLVVDEADENLQRGLDQNLTARFSAVLAAADGLLLPNESLRAAMPKSKQIKAVAALKTDAETREGLWLMLDGPEETVEDIGRWLKTLVPILNKAIPKTSLHALKHEGLRLPAEVKSHKTSDALLLGQMRVALAPFRLPGLDQDAITACTAAGLPIIVTPAALNGAPLFPGMVEVPANAQAIARLLRKLEDQAAWDALASPLHLAQGFGNWTAAYRNLAKSLKLMSR